jgi:ubiquinone/menaquinone biosynthesis C-methylase UbiE
MIIEQAKKRAAAFWSTDKAGVPGGPGERMLRQLRLLYAPFAEFVAGEGGPQPVVVDIGTGSGIVLERIRERVPAATLIGLDIRTEPMLLGAPALTFIRADAAHLPVATDSVDIVVSRSALGYCDDHGQVIGEILRILKPGGSAYITDANAGPIQRLLIIGFGMLLLRRGYADMSGFSDRALSKKRLIALLSRVGVNDYEYGRLFLGTYFRLVIRKPLPGAARSGDFKLTEG